LPGNVYLNEHLSGDVNEMLFARSASTSPHFGGQTRQFAPPALLYTRVEHWRQQ
jgi:hypothetical protein